MFTDSLDYNITLHTSDLSLHGGIPKQYYGKINNYFGDWEIPPWELFIFNKRLLGKGSFSEVYLAKWRGTFVVAKIINRVICEQEKELVLREITIMTKLHHPNIVQFLGYIDSPFILVMEYIPNNDLLHFIKEKKLYKSEKKRIMRDILQGVAYIHNRKPYSLIHRDLKPTNILLTKSKVAKITDFGLSKFNKKILQFNEENKEIEKETDKETEKKFKNSNDTKKNSNDLTKDVGTERYMAPELNIKDLDYSNKIDIYSCGILLYEMFENKRYIVNQPFKWYYTPKKIRNLIVEHMLCENPENRSDALTILNIYNGLTL